MLIAGIRAGADDVVAAMLPRMLARPMPDETRTYLERWQAAGRRPPEDPPRFLMLPALGYIPNFAGG